VSAEQLASLAGAAVLVFWMVGAYNRLVRLRNAIGAAWSQLDLQLQRRAVALPAMLAALESPMAAEQRTFDAVSTAQRQVQSASEQLRVSAVRPDAAAALMAALAQLDATLARLLSLLDQHAELRSGDAVATPLREMHDADLRLAFARQLYNDAVQAYNAALDQFPTRLLTGFFRFGPAGQL
jgi:LemA protein